jgi:hypothetical protein
MDKETITITIDLVNNTYNARHMTPELALAALILMRTGLGLRHVAELLLVNKGSMKSAVEKLTSADFRQPVAAEERNNNEDHGEDTRNGERVGDGDSDADTRGDEFLVEEGRRDDALDADDDGSIRVEYGSGGAVSVAGAGTGSRASPVRDAGEGEEKSEYEQHDAPASASFSAGSSYRSSHGSDASGEKGESDSEQENIDGDLSFRAASIFRSSPASDTSEEKVGSDCEREQIDSDVSMAVYSTPASDTSEETTERSEFQVSVGLCRQCSSLAGDANSGERDMDSYVETLDFPDDAPPCPDYSTAKGCTKGAACLYAHKKSSLRSLLEYLGSAHSSIDVCMHLITSDVVRTSHLYVVFVLVDV